MKIAEYNKDALNFSFEDNDDLRRKLTKIYTVDGRYPVINMKGDIIEVWVEDCIYAPAINEYNKAAALCNNHEYDKAEPILKGIIQKYPILTEAFRVLGQIESERGNYDKAIDYLLSALLINPTHIWSLILMGNIYTRKEDFETGRIYYDKALEYNPDNLQAINNVGVDYMRQKKYDDAIDLFKKVLQKNSTYMNSYLGLAISYRMQGNTKDSISTCIEGLRKGKSLPQDRNLEENLRNELIQSCKCFVYDFDYSIEVEMQKKKLAGLTSVPLRVEPDENLKIHAMMEYSVAHRRNYNRVVYNPTKLFQAHMIMHELTHLEMYLKASKEGRNMFTVGGETEKAAFYKWISPELGRLRSKLTKEHLAEFLDQMINGIMLQATNAPLDLLVEDSIYNNYPNMRPLQFLSLYEMEVGNIKSVNEAAKTDIPHKLISVNRIMNMVGSYHLNELYGIDLSAKYHATLREERIAIDLYEEYLAYRDNYQPGDEYELMAYFAETLGLDDFFRIVPESRFTKADNLAKTFTPEEKIDPESHDEQNAAFAENNGDSNPVVTMMMTMYMQGALEYLNGMPQSDIQRLAFEIANVGVNGISPNKAYTLKSIPNREFGGYELLAYYYVSWAIAFPDKVDLLGLPFKNSYEAAKGNLGKKK